MKLENLCSINWWKAPWDKWLGKRVIESTLRTLDFTTNPLAHLYSVLREITCK